MIGGTVQDIESESKGELGLPYGAWSKIARRLRPKVTPQHVREVALGRRKSERVARAIENYRRGLERQQSAA